VELVDTHCHVHFPDYPLEPDEVLEAARREEVRRFIAVGCTLPDSRGAVDIAARHSDVWASIGLHPHEAKVYVGDDHALQQFHDLAGKPKVVAIGETGLDYFYEHSPRDTQKKLLRFQLDLAVEHDLPLIFHIRDAFDDFWPIFDSYQSAGQRIRGVVHSFTAHKRQLEQLLERGLYVGLNGIMTFTRDAAQLEAAKAVPDARLLLETDAPFLTPYPFRGTICEPKHVRVTAEFLSKLRGESLEDIARASTDNAKNLFKI
jgi:TatD DNase family protein